MYYSFVSYLITYIYTFMYMYAHTYKHTHICIYSKRFIFFGGGVDSNSHHFGEENVRAQMFIFES